MGTALPLVLRAGGLAAVYGFSAGGVGGVGEERDLTDLHPGGGSGDMGAAADVRKFERSRCLVPTCIDESGGAVNEQPDLFEQITSTLFER